MHKYCSDFGLDPTKFRLVFDGEVLNVKVQTAESLDIEDEDVIDVAEIKKK